MKRIVAWALLFICACPTLPAMCADEPLVLSVWPGKAPGDSGVGQYGPIPQEHVRPPSGSPTTNVKWLTDVTKPTIMVFRPPKDRNTGAAMLVCPGGGYWDLAWDLEGTEVAAWLAEAGITGVVLKYRVPRRKGEPERLPASGPLMDAQRALSLVRSKAQEWGIDPDRIGIGGFSAGGHLALATATNFDERAYEGIDAIDKVSCRPNFAVAVYPGYLVKKETGALSPIIHIPAKTPPIFLAHASEDKISDAENSVIMYLALKKCGIPTELHVYETGGHGWGVRKSDKPCSEWADRCMAWLRNLGMLTASATR